MGLTAVHRGPLLYANDELGYLLYSAFESFLDGPDPRYGIDPSTAHTSDVRVRKEWSPTAPPTRRAISVAACTVGWKLWPLVPPTHIERGKAACLSPVANITLTAYAVSSNPAKVRYSKP